MANRRKFSLGDLPEPGTVFAMPLADGRTRLTLTTHHELDLAPATYWTPIAQWAVHENKRRVLAHFRDQAEHR